MSQALPTASVSKDLLHHMDPVELSCQRILTSCRGSSPSASPVGAAFCKVPSLDMGARYHHVPPPLAWRVTVAQPS